MADTSQRFMENRSELHPLGFAATRTCLVGLRRSCITWGTFVLQEKAAACRLLTLGITTEPPNSNISPLLTGVSFSSRRSGVIMTNCIFLRPYYSMTCAMLAFFYYWPPGSARQHTSVTDEEHVNLSHIVDTVPMRHCVLLPQ